MSITVAEAEAQCREFADWHQGENTKAAVALAASGQVSWFQIYDLFCKATVDAMVDAEKSWI